MKPKTNHYTLGQAAKLNPLGVGRTRFVEKLHEHRFLIADGSPRQKFIDRKYFVYTLKRIRNASGKLIKEVPVVLVTSKGLHYLNTYFLKVLNPTPYVS